MVGTPSLAAPAPETITVIGATPLPGAGMDINKSPSAVNTVNATDVDRDGLTGALADHLGSANINDNLDDDFQPDILYRGFEASPVLGTPEGLAVYQNGVRINEAFGETVNWDLIADLAVSRVSVVGANPVFGLNALGGAVVVEMKNGFSDPGGQVELAGGSLARRSASVEWGAHSEHFGVYLAARGVDQAGWRASPTDHIRQIYGDIGARSDKLKLDLTFTGADNHLFGESATPVQELAVNRALLFTNPQENINRLAFVTLAGDYAATSTLSLQAVAYFRKLRQNVVNGNTTSYVACGAGPNVGDLCQSDALTPLNNAGGGLIPDISNGGATPIGENDRERTVTRTFGGSLQATSTAGVWGRENHLAVGASLDHAVTDFSSTAEVGVINAAITVLPSGLFVDTPQKTGFAATPVSLNARSTYLGLFATDTFNPTSRWAITLSGRYNLAQITLADRVGTDLNGRNRYARFNPAIGMTYQFAPVLTAYAGYAEGGRAPNPSEIECSNPVVPCLLPSSLASDPPTLRQVVSHTWEAGLRGRLDLGARREGESVTWSAGVFRTVLDDDIYGVATGLGAGFFRNIGGSERRGVELSLHYHAGRLTAFTNYSLVDATFRSAFALPSPSNPFQDANGDIQVRRGDHLPGIPKNRLKIGADVDVRPGWSVGGSVAWTSGQVYRGDESNQLAPLPGYAVVNLHATARLTRASELFVTVNNALNARYASFGILGDPTGVGAPGVPTSGAGVDPRFQSPANPIAVTGGVRVGF